MANSDGSLFGSGTFTMTDDWTKSLAMNSLMISCIKERNNWYTKIRDIPSSHQEAVAWVLVNDNDYTI